mmetsp:Transcript_32151/g.51768  ORF Transcript_32151/g.51768 Transcript_32151/m.51768 type:complete len:85 (-) Transcript_32151:22-276(-)
MATLNVLLFGPAREAIDAGSIQVSGISPEASVAQLREAVSEQFPALKELLVISRFSVDQELIRDESTVIPAGAELAMIPPISGG